MLYAVFAFQTKMTIRLSPHHRHPRNVTSLVLMELADFRARYLGARYFRRGDQRYDGVDEKLYPKYKKKNRYILTFFR